MAKSNPHFLKLKREYIFPIIEKKLTQLKQEHPNAEIINIGIGDVSLPLAPAIAKAIADATNEMTQAASVRGYGPSEGYSFLKNAISLEEYKELNISPEQIFITDGINSDIASALELFHKNSSVAIPDPAYPVYLDTSVMAGKKISLMPCLEENRCLPIPPSAAVDILYLCSPSNPCAVAMNRDELKSFIDYAKKHAAIILYDNAYSSFITSDDVPKSIYEIEGADEVAIEFRSFSKSAGFTGLRCGYTIVPKKIKVKSSKKQILLWDLWMKRVSIKSNGVSYPIQKGALSCFSTEGKQQIAFQVQTYLESAKLFREGLKSLGYTCYGGIDSPFIWWKVPSPYTSWQFFDLLLNQCHIVTIPGRGFGEHGEGFIRLSAFTQKIQVITALERIKNLKL